MRALIATLLLVASHLAWAQLSTGDKPVFGSAQQVEFLPVEEAYQLEVEISGEDSLRLYWLIAPEYYLYQHRFKFSLQDADGEIPVEATLPPALEREDEYFGQVRVYYTDADISLQAARAPGAGARLTVESQGCADAGLCYPPRKEYFALDPANGVVTVAGPPANTPTRTVPDTGGATADLSALLPMLLAAFIGGAILNLMPCVFPILSLKVLSFARSTDHDRHLHSWLYAAGVVASFVLVAVVLIALQGAGRAVGWGFQLQSPGFVIALAYLFVVMGLSLSGLIELGSSLMNSGSSLAERQGPAGSFFTGVLAVVVASPCTAPFMGSALGFAVTQPPLIGLTVFAALGAGMAAPLLLFSYSGVARKLMPQPGPWMETLKQLLAFPLYGTAIWLLWVAGRQTGVNTMAAALGGALALALGLWLWRFGGWRRGLALLCAVAAISLGSWRGIDSNGATHAVLGEGQVVWSRQAMDNLRSEGKPVFVDVTADWCITCIANETAVLFTDDMQAAFAERGIVYMVADWTNYDPEIAAFIADHGRTGIPLYLADPADPAAQPRILPQLLTAGTVIEALDAISSKKTEVAQNIATEGR